jgi:hypothetical protein
MDSVYVIGPENGPFKIGISNDVERRLVGLQTGNPNRLTIHFSMEHPQARDLEARLHAAFARDNLVGEWFETPLDTIREALIAGIPVNIGVTDWSMSAPSFCRWLADMKSAGLARSDAECARLLGISANSVVSLKKNGADTRTALACRALLHRLEPYS